MNKKTGIILGSGLTKFLEEIKSPQLILSDKESFHKLKIFSGKIENKEVVLFSGRRHFYEGYSQNKVLENVNLAKELGVERLIITNAAGGINKNFKVSDLMLIMSHFNFIKKNIPAAVCTDMYSKTELNLLRKIAIEEKLNLKYGSYCCLYGPNYETRSEIRFLKKFGIDAVGMSTVPEVIQAKKLGIKTIAISCITNLLYEQSGCITDHDEVVSAGINAYPDFSKLLKRIISHPF